MEPPMHSESSIIPINVSELEEIELTEDEHLSCKRKRSNVLGPVSQPSGGITSHNVEDSKGPDALPVEASTGKKHKDEAVTNHQAGSTGAADGCRKEHVKGHTNRETARSRLLKICMVNHWNQPSFELCLEQGPPHAKLFTYKVSVNVDTVTNTILECFGEPKFQKKSAQEHAAEGALWCLKHFGHVK